MNTHLWGWMKICMKSNCFWICFKWEFMNCFFFLLCLDYSKRVYQGVRVKHTVKDLLAEKRSRQTNGPRYSVSTTSSKPSCLCPVLSLPTSFFSQTKQCSHSWHSVGGIIERSPFEKKKSPPFVYILACFVDQRSMVDPLTTCTHPPVSAPLKPSQSQSVNNWAQCMCKETQSPILTSQKHTMCAIVMAMISQKLPLGGSGGWGGKVEVDR